MGYNAPLQRAARPLAATRKRKADCMITWGAAVSRQILSRGIVEQSLLVIPFHDLARVRLQLLLLLICAVHVLAVAAWLATAAQRERAPYPSSKVCVRGRGLFVTGCADPEAPGEGPATEQDGGHRA